MEINGVVHIQLTVSDLSDLEACKRSDGSFALRDGPWAPGDDAVLFEDPDRIRLAVNHVPGKGNLDPSLTLPLPRPPVP